MGYTHYWRAENVNNTKYQAALTDIEKIVKEASKTIPLARWDGKEGTSPLFNDGISFNGVEDNGCETFSIPKKSSELKGFDFCKTRNRPYDVVVTASLTRLAEVENIHVSSDGDEAEWEDGVTMASEILGRKLVNPVGNERTWR